MPRGPMPWHNTEGLTSTDIAAHKHDDCKYYERCLDDAARAGWSQFHCDDCTVFTVVVVDITSLPRPDPAYFAVRIRG